MSFKTLRNDELAAVAEFFLKDVEVADTEKGPTKKELLAALASGEPDTDDAPVTWDQYEEIYLPALERPAPVQPVAVIEDVEVPVLPEGEVTLEQAPKVLIKMERDQGRFEFRGATFKREHPFAFLTEVDATFLVQHEDGFRLAMPSEVDSYYK